MKRYLIIGILVIFTPIWLVLLFIFGQNITSYLFLNESKLALSNIKPPKIFIVQSGSLEPSIKLGSIVIVTPDKTYVNGDIVSFDPNGSGKNIITNRIAFKDYPNGVNGEAQYITTGDANEDFDTNKITKKNI